jgi:hypothetical protein
MSNLILKLGNLLRESIRIFVLSLSTCSTFFYFNILFYVILFYTVYLSITTLNR